jgi:hypothetical protein
MIIDNIKKSIFDLQKIGTTATKVCMSIWTMDELINESHDEIVALSGIGGPTYLVCCLPIEIHNELEKGTIYII